MTGIHQILQISLLQFLFLLSLSAQNSEKPLSEMSWKELTDQWESLANIGNNTTALPYARAALEKARNDSSMASLDYGNSLDYLGYSLHHTGQYSEAEQCFLAAVEHARVHLGENHEDYITRLSNLAMLHMDMDELAQAASELESAVHLAGNSLSHDNPYVAIIVNNLGLAYEKIGNLDRAIEYYHRALELTERTVGKENVRYGIRLSNIAAVYRKTGKNEQALDCSLRALSIFEKTGGKNNLNYASGLTGLIGSYLALSRVEEAIPLGDSLKALLEKGFQIETPETYDFTATIANLCYQAGQYERCATYCKKALAKYQEIFPRQYARHAFVASLAMESLEKQGNMQESALYALLVNRYSLEEMRENFSKFSEDEQLQMYHTYREGTDAPALLFAVRHPEFPELVAAVYDYQMTIKGLSLTNQRELFQSLRNHPDESLAAQFEEWKRLQNGISKQYALNPTRRQTNLDSLLAQSNALERSLAIGSEPFRLAHQADRWKDVQAALMPNEAAIEFIQLSIAHTDSMLYFASILRSDDSAPHQVFLFEQKELGNLTATRRLYAYSLALERNNLHTLLWENLEPFLKGISTIYFAPAGVLHQINFAGVPVSDKEIVSDRFKLHRLVSTRQVLTLGKNLDQITPKTALVFGGIRYETDSIALLTTNTAVLDTSSTLSFVLNRGKDFGDAWDFLSGSLKEAQDVRNQLENIGAKVLFANGFNASEGLLKKTIQISPSPTVIHLATHGFFLASPDSSGHSGFSVAENPMVRAGLVLSGANRVWNGREALAGQEDGILTALEISRMNLSNTELAVLSACETGKGKLAGAEGVLGLQRAFKMAGTHYVIMTLWNVQDHDAQQFMGIFYNEWLLQKKTIPDAFRVAQRKMRLLHSMPFQPSAWAGFVLLE